MPTNFIEELKWRGLLFDITPETEKFLLERPEKGYIGFNGNDPFIGRKSGVGIAFQDNKVRPVDGDDGSWHLE